MRSSPLRVRVRRAAAILLHLPLLLLLLLLPSPPAVSGELLLTYTVTRHGARNVLPKNATLHEGDAAGGPALLPAGWAASRAAGAAFRARYLDPATCNATCLTTRDGASGSGGSGAGGDRASGYGLVGAPGAAFSNYDTLARSSALDRTLSSAYAFLAGAFPASSSGGGGSSGSSANGSAAAAAVVPVYPAAGADADDWLVRAYTKCPAYEARLRRWLASPEFAAKAAASEATRAAVAEAAPGVDVKLENWWNVYDAFNVWRKHRVGAPQPPISDALFAGVVRLADWLETAKMRPELAGSGLGGGLLGDLVARLEAAAAAAARGGSRPYFRLLHTSAHYNTQLALLSALGLAAPAVTPAQLPWLDKIPATSAALVFELHRADGGTGDASGDGPAVRLVIQDGPNEPWRVVPLVPCGGANDAGNGAVGLEGACPLGAFLELARRRALPNVAAWCAACENEEMAACAALRARGGGGGNGGGAKGLASAAAARWQMAATVLASVAGGAALAAIIFGIALRRRPQAAAGAGDFEAGGGGGAEGRALRLDKTDSASLAPAHLSVAGGRIGPQF